VRDTLRSATTDRATILRIARDSRFCASRGILRLLVRHPNAPSGLARNLLAGWRWGDLADLAADPAVASALRRDAERLLVARWDALSRGERVSLARRATHAVLGVAFSPGDDPSVARAALDNPRLREPDVLRVASDPRTRPGVLAAIGDHASWAERAAVRLALARNARTPSRNALRAVAELSERALRALALDPSVPRLVRIGAGRRLEQAAREQPGPGTASDSRRPAALGYE